MSRAGLALSQAAKFDCLKKQDPHSLVGASRASRSGRLGLLAGADRGRGVGGLHLSGQGCAVLEGPQDCLMWSLVLMF